MPVDGYGGRPSAEGSGWGSRRRTSRGGPDVPGNRRSAGIPTYFQVTEKLLPLVPSDDGKAMTGPELPLTIVMATFEPALIDPVDPPIVADALLKPVVPKFASVERVQLNALQSAGRSTTHSAELPCAEVTVADAEFALPPFTERDTVYAPEAYDTLAETLSPALTAWEDHATMPAG